MKIQEIRDLSVDELQQKELALREELFNLKFQYATGQLENIMRLKEVRRDIAKVLTVATEKQSVTQAASK